LKEVVVKKFVIAKWAVSAVAAYGAGIVVAHVIANNVPLFALPVHKKVAVTIAGAVIGMLINDAVKSKVDEQFEEGLSLYTKLKSKWNEA
jgi:hypothetical protein